MGASKLQAALLTAAAAIAATSWPARAQCRLCAAPVTSRDDSTAKQDVQIEIQTSIDFDRLILVGEGDGAAVIRPDGSRAAEGMVVDVGPARDGRSARPSTAKPAARCGSSSQRGSSSIR